MPSLALGKLAPSLNSNAPEVTGAKIVFVRIPEDITRHAPDLVDFATGRGSGLAAAGLSRPKSGGRSVHHIAAKLDFGAG